MLCNQYSSMLVNKKAFVIFRIQCPLAYFYQITIKSIVSYDNAIVCLKIYDTIIDWYNLCVVKSIKTIVFASSGFVLFIYVYEQLCMLMIFFVLLRQF